MSSYKFQKSEDQKKKLTKKINKQTNKLNEQLTTSKNNKKK